MIALEDTLYRITYVGNRSKGTYTYWGKVELQDGKPVIPVQILPVVEDIGDKLERETITGLVEADVIHGIHHIPSMEDRAKSGSKEKTTYFLVHESKAYELSSTRIKGHMEGSSPLETFIEELPLCLFFNR